MIAAAMTPVVVSIVKELLERPMQSEVVRRTAGRVTESAARRVVTGAAARTEQARRSSPTASVPPPLVPNGNGNGNGRGGDLTAGDVVLSHPRKTYGSGGGSRLRRAHLKLAVVTGLLAFVIAAAVLTLPELVLGGSVGGESRTTFFGGESRSEAERREQDGGDRNQPSQPEAGPRAPSGEGGTTPPAPDDEAPAEPSPEEPQPAPQEPAPPSGGSPVPQTPAPAAP